MKRLSLLTVLLLTSSMVCAEWKYYKFDSQNKIYTTTPQGFCMEAICENGCVEDIQTNNGVCCPVPVEGENCVSDTIDEKGCVLSLRKTCASNQYCNKNTKTCQPIPVCDTCQKFDTDNGQCVVDSSKNNQQIQDACHMCQNGKVVLKDLAKQFISNNSCVECLTDANCPNGYTCDANKKECHKPCVKNVDWGGLCAQSCQCKDGTGKYSGWSGVCQEGVCCFSECTVCGSKAYCPPKGCSSKSDCPSGHYCSNGECLACPQRVEIPTYQGCKSTSDNRLCVIGTRIGSTSYKKNTQWVNPYQCTYNVYFSGTLDTKAKSKAHNKVYINGGHALGYDSRKYTYSDSYIGQLAPGGGVEVEIYNNSGRPCSSLSAWMTLAE